MRRLMAGLLVAVLMAACAVAEDANVILDAEGVRLVASGDWFVEDNWFGNFVPAMNVQCLNEFGRDVSVSCYECLVNGVEVGCSVEVWPVIGETVDGQIRLIGVDDECGIDSLDEIESITMTMIVYDEETLDDIVLIRDIDAMIG